VSDLTKVKGPGVAKPPILRKNTMKERELHVFTQFESPNHSETESLSLEGNQNQNTVGNARKI
jgi:hypothetical protein